MLLLFCFISCIQGFSSLSLDYTLDVSLTNPCKNAEPGIKACVHINVDIASLNSDQNLPFDHVLPLIRHFKHNEKTNVYLYDDKFGSDMMIVEREGRVMARVTMSSGDIFFIEPCNNWSGCHVWKQYAAQDIFVEETEVPDKDIKMFDPERSEKLSKLRSLGKSNQDEMSEYSIKFYYTNQFMASTDDIALFADTVVIDMNLGYENSNVPVRVKTHCIEHADIDDQQTSSDTLHVFNDLKPSYEEIRGSADAAQLLANNFENCGSGYTYTVPKGNGHTLSTVKKSCSYGYHSSIHEVGHNFGCTHDKGNGDNSYYDYGYGWLIGPSDLDGVGYRTVLAYNNIGYSRRVLHLSNPDVEYAGYPTGDAVEADNARVIRDNRFLMENIGDESQSC